MAHSYAVPKPAASPVTDRPQPPSHHPIAASPIIAVDETMGAAHYRTPRRVRHRRVA
jgi:hypothetical protein